MFYNCSGIKELDLRGMNTSAATDMSNMFYNYISGKIIDYFTSSTTKLYDYEPIYEELDGWDEDITNARTYDELPANAKKYIEFIEEHLGINVYLVSVGPERSQNIIRKDLF